MKKWFLFSAICLLLCCQSTSAADTRFIEAVKDYNAGKYAEALTKLNAVKASYPKNPMTRYYLALCHQALNHVSDAKTEYQFVTSYGDATLKSHAEKGLAQLGSLKSQIGSSGGSSGASAGGSGVPSGVVMPRGETKGPTPPAAGGGGTKVKKVIEFYADW